MTVRELYEWATKHDALDLEMEYINYDRCVQHETVEENLVDIQNGKVVLN